MKKPSLIQVTAIIMVGVCLYSIITNLGALSYGAKLSQTYAKSVVSIYILILIVISACGIIAGVGLYFYKAWSRPCTIVISAVLLFQSLPFILRIIIPGGHISIFDIRYIIYVVFAIWCLYYLNRSDVKEKFKKAIPETIPL